MLLFLLHLFLGLPNLIPKSTIEYQALLGETLVKTIELQNPSKKRVIYEVTMEGSQNFSTETKHIILPPESAMEVPVSFRANFSDPVKAVISFWGVREGGAAGTSMVFNLSAVITGRIPVEVIRRSIGLFELDKFAVTFKSQFDKPGTFPLLMTVEHEPLSIEDAIKGTAPKKKKKLVSSFGFAEAAPAADKFKTEEDLEAERLFKVGVLCFALLCCVVLCCAMLCFIALWCIAGVKASRPLLIHAFIHIAMHPFNLFADVCNSCMHVHVPGDLSTYLSIVAIPSFHLFVHIHFQRVNGSQPASQPAMPLLASLSHAWAIVRFRFGATRRCWSWSPARPRGCSSSCCPS